MHPGGVMMKSSVYVYSLSTEEFSHDIFMRPQYFVSGIASIRKQSREPRIVQLSSCPGNCVQTPLPSALNSRDRDAQSQVATSSMM
eukprot:Skav231140  [mRNA]  locus=scaffold2333:34202:35108:- [translate_table: standard]